MPGHVAAEIEDGADKKIGDEDLDQKRRAADKFDIEPSPDR